MQDNFSWIEEKVIAGSSIPITDNHFKYLEEEGIKTIINLTSKPTPAQYGDRFKLIHLPIPDFSIPDYDTIAKFWQYVSEAEKKNEPVLVHCFAGCGRTGTMLAIWAMLRLKLSGAEAIDYIRDKRECSIETGEQMEFIRNFDCRRIKMQIR